MEPILVIENDPRDPLGHLGLAIEARGYTTEIIKAPAGDPIPEPHDYSAVVILGGPQGAYEAEKHPYLDDEMDLIRTAVAIDKPLLGICLGSQLAAHALGGRAFLSPKPEVAIIEPQLTEEGEQDPLAPFISRPFLTFHQDTFEPPPQATVIAHSDMYTQAFRCGSALAIQPHPEVFADDVAHWVASSPIPERAGADGQAIVAGVKASVKPDDAADLFNHWLDQIATN